MNTYDKLAFTNRPTLYLSAPEITDKSNSSLYTLDNNNLSPLGQPIIYGNSASFIMDDTKTVDIIGNPIFFNSNASAELVVVAKRPEEITSIFVDDEGLNALQITPEGITLKLFFENMLSVYSNSVTIRIKDWNKKLYINISITDNQAALIVNDQSDSITYTDSIVVSDNITIGGGADGYQYLIDGIGFYNTTVQNKFNLINDPGSYHKSYAGIKHAGRTTLFDGYQQGYAEEFKLSDLIFADEQYTLIYYVSAVEEGLDYLSITTNDESVYVSYDIDLDDSGEFVEYLLVGTVNDSTIRLTVDASAVDDDFTIRIKAIYNSDILYDTPADLILSGVALYGEPAESIVNYPDGTKLDQATYAGTWIYDQQFAGIPKSIEIVFKPFTESTYVFYSSDGEVSTTQITGYTAYLNGVVVTDLADMKIDQWNHLVLNLDSPAATEFYLNSDDGLFTDGTISYMYLTAYPNELTEDQVEVLYSIALGTDKIVVEEPALTITEGEFPNGYAFNYYSYAWAIVGAGGT